MEWIDLAQQTPDDGDVVLVWMPDSMNHMEIVRYEEARGFWDLENDWEAHGNVTHWMRVEPPGKA
ncbi:DUF551 domain-containing protein [Ferrimonas marina]|uniref:DUF551 domain-containing protein n=1 Tax=Ferrimonas marina TaxID=299255 RepID=A0A1M5X8Y3_9GAMM|nr:DUF551 domain-containing protein [Ferrimonas marina]SHH96285.1 Protein of unknown function [Ferrimonas marina]